MKKHILLFATIAVAFALISNLSYSYYKKNLNDKKDNALYEDYENQKQTKSKGNLTLATSFENDYYTDNNRIGYFYAEVQAAKFKNENTKQKPLNISLVIDRSGSMAGVKLANAKKAAKYLIDQLNEDDYVSIIIYDNRVDVLQTSTHPINKRLIKSKIDEITDRGNTNLMGGAEAGYQQVQKKYDEQYINRVLLLSDGLANEGITDMQSIKRIVKNYSNRNGITISTFGLGADYNEDLMTTMAEAGMGNYYFINYAEDIAGIFIKELNGLKEVVAKNVELTISIPENVSIENVYGGNEDQALNKLVFKMRDIFSEETKGFLIKYAIKGKRNTPVTFETTLKYNDLSRERNEEIRISSTSNHTNDEHHYSKHFNEWVSTQITLYVSNEKMENAMKEVDRGNYDEAKKLIQENKEYMKDKKSLVSKSKELQKAEKNYINYDKQIDAAPTMPESELKVMQKGSKSANYEIRNKK